MVRRILAVAILLLTSGKAWSMDTDQLRAAVEERLRGVKLVFLSKDLGSNEDSLKAIAEVSKMVYDAYTGAK